MTEAVQRVVSGVQTGGEKASPEESLKVPLLESDPGPRLRRDAEDRGVCAAVLGAVDADQGIQSPNGAPVGVGCGRQRNSLDTLGVLDRLGFANRENDAFLRPANVAPGEEISEKPAGDCWT